VLKIEKILFKSTVYKGKLFNAGKCYSGSLQNNPDKVGIG